MKFLLQSQLMIKNTECRSQLLDNSETVLSK